MRKVGFAYNPAIAPSASLLELGMRWCSEHGIEGWAAPPDEVGRIRELGPGTDVVWVLG